MRIRHRCGRDSAGRVDQIRHNRCRGVSGDRVCQIGRCRGRHLERLCADRSGIGIHERGGLILLQAAERARQLTIHDRAARIGFRQISQNVDLRARVCLRERDQ